MSSLDHKIRDFLPTLRLGVDFGETAGGIALVRGREILHAETFVDFHESTLEVRRTLRRGRRTRHARKMRIARLRSWLLRQKITAGRGYRRKAGGWEPGGDRLPDPYWLSAQPRYQTKPGVYKSKKADPLLNPGWIDEAKAGRVDAAGFVCALTLIFKKRGYKYDDEDFSDYLDKRLLEFLESCCMLSQDATLAKQLLQEIESRESEGKKKPKLREAYQKALNRPKEPRKALPRALVERELAEVITGFANSVDLDEKAKSRWIKELIGGPTSVGLLNRFVRLPRFENRIKATCSWCEKKTPRTAKVLELQYRAAVRNIRAHGPSGWQRLIPEQEKPLLDWWHLWQLRMEGKHQFSRSPKAVPTERSPTKDNIEKYLWNIGAKTSLIKGKDGRYKPGFPIARQLEDILKNKRKGGRAGLCREHLQMASEGKTMKDAGIEWHTMRVRKAPNPRREQHDERVLRRLEAILFRRGKTGKDAWRHGPVSIITLEVPEPATQRVGKGEMTERQDLSKKEYLHKETGGVCVYTGRPVSLEEAEIEHIVPRSKGGPDVRTNLVCASKVANDEKDNRLPSEWLGWGSPKFEEFRRRVESMPGLPKEKKELLVLEPGKSYPENETPLAHVGARPRQFVAGLTKLFKDYGVEPPTLHYDGGKPLVQRANGRWTTGLRRSWLFSDTPGKIPNFPEKDRRDLHNHAQDAALLAATPPHTWQDQILCERAIRPCAKKDAQGRIVRKNGIVETEMRQRPGVARLDLAPDWRGFAASCGKPIVRVLGRKGLRWHTQLVKQSLFQAPDDLNAPKLKIRKVPAQGSTVQPGQRRMTVETQKSSGLVLKIPVHDPTGIISHRKMEAKEGIDKEGAVFWRDAKGKIQISMLRPTALQRLAIPRLEPDIPNEARILDRWFRQQIIPLPADGVFQAGYYRVKEINDGGVIVIPENAATKQMAEALGLDPDEITNPERKLGKRDLDRLFPSTGQAASGTPNVLLKKKSTPAKLD